MRDGYEGPKDYLKPLSREQERDLAERMFWKKLQLFDMTVGSLDCINSVYDAASKENDEKRLKRKITFENPPKYVFSVKPRNEDDAPKQFNFPTLMCLLETAKECPTTPNRSALRDYFTLHPAKSMEFFREVRSHPEIGAVCREYLRLHTTLVKHNRLFVRTIAKTPREDLTYEERVEAGEIGLITAAYKFDVYEGFKFSTYATWWINHTIGRASQTTKVVHIPIYAQTEKEYKGTTPTETSLDDRGSEEHGLLSHLEDKKSPNPLNEVAKTELVGDFDRLLKRIMPREANILRMRHGFGGIDPMTLQEVAEKYNLSKERIRQIEKEALKKLAVHEKFAEAM